MNEKDDIDFKIMRPKGFFQQIYKINNMSIKAIGRNGWIGRSFCPICGTEHTHKNKTLYDINGIESRVCNKCDCLWNDKVPKKRNLSFDDKAFEKELIVLNKEKDSYRKQRFMKERLTLINKSLNKVRLLDVGCYTGLFLEVAKKYCKEVEGVESTKRVAENTSKRIGVKVYSDIKAAKGLYDVITLFDVIEHIDEPVKFLENIMVNLKSKGVFIIFTPNWQSLGFGYLKEKSNQYCPTDHLQFFSKKTVDYLTNELGMDLVLYETKGMDMFDIWAYERDIKGKQIALSELCKVNEIQNFINTSGYANHMRIIWRKR